MSAPVRRNTNVPTMIATMAIRHPPPVIRFVEIDWCCSRARVIACYVDLSSASYRCGFARGFGSFLQACSLPLVGLYPVAQFFRVF